MTDELERFLEKWYTMGHLMKDGLIKGVTPAGIHEIGNVLIKLIDTIDDLPQEVNKYERNMGRN